MYNNDFFNNNDANISGNNNYTWKRAGKNCK